MIVDIDEFSDVVKNDEEEETETVLDKIRDLFTGEDSDKNVAMLSGMTGLDGTKIQKIVVPVMGVIEKHGLKFISGGDSAKEASLSGKLKTVDKYASVIFDFMPLFGAIKEMIKGDGPSDINISSDEWDTMPSVDSVIDVEGEEQEDVSDFLRDDATEEPSQQHAAPKPAVNHWEKLVSDYGEKFGAEAMNEIRGQMEKEGKIPPKTQPQKKKSLIDDVDPGEDFFFD